MPFEGGMTASGSLADQFIDTEIGKEVTYQVTYKFMGYHRDEFGATANFDLVKVEGSKEMDNAEAAQDLHTANVLEVLGSVPHTG